MSNPLRTPEDYELFLYTISEQFPSVIRSTVVFARKVPILIISISNPILNIIAFLHLK
jgi:hypothetical protein